jgi:predicted nucleic acid-binding protein
VPSQTLAESIPPGASLLIDTSVALAYLSGTEPTSPVATQLFDDHLANGRESGALSMVTVGEILVRPFRAGPEAVAVAEGFLRHFAGLQLVDVDYAIAREAARIRASTDLRMPDALIVASALAIAADRLVTNDRRLATAAERLGIGACVLASFRAS